MRLALAVVGVAASSCALVAPFDVPPDPPPECSSGDPSANGGCDWTCNDPGSVHLEVTFLPLTAPRGLATDFARVAVSLALQAGWFVWLIDVEEHRFRTGQGECDTTDSTHCHFVAEPPTTNGIAALEPATGEFRLPADGLMRVDLGVRLSDDPEPVVLPLREAVLGGRVEHGGNCIGTYSGEGWQAGALLTAKLAVDESQDVWLDIFNSTLCDELAGTDCTMGDPSTWPTPPDTTVGGQPAWAVESEVAAVGVRIDP